MLVGMMGSGKTTVGRLLAARTGWSYADNDELVRRSSGREPADIRATDGEMPSTTSRPRPLWRRLGCHRPRSSAPPRVWCSIRSPWPRSGHPRAWSGCGRSPPHCGAHRLGRGAACGSHGHRVAHPAGLGAGRPVPRPRRSRHRCGHTVDTTGRRHDPALVGAPGGLTPLVEELTSSRARARVPAQRVNGPIGKHANPHSTGSTAVVPAGRMYRPIPDLQGVPGDPPAGCISARMTPRAPTPIAQARHAGLSDGVASRGGAVYGAAVQQRPRAAEMCMPWRPLEGKTGH